MEPLRFICINPGCENYLNKNNEDWGFNIPYSETATGDAKYNAYGEYKGQEQTDGDNYSEDTDNAECQCCQEIAIDVQDKGLIVTSYEKEVQDFLAALKL